MILKWGTYKEKSTHPTCVIVEDYSSPPTQLANPRVPLWGALQAKSLAPVRRESRAFDLQTRGLKYLTLIL